MRIIKSGREKEWQITCPSCGTELAYKTEDISLKEKRCGEYRCAFAHQVKTVVCCAECGRDVDVPGFASQLREVVKEDEWDD